MQKKAEFHLSIERVGFGSLEQAHQSIQTVCQGNYTAMRYWRRCCDLTGSLHNKSTCVIFALLQKAELRYYRITANDIQEY